MRILSNLARLTAILALVVVFLPGCGTSPDKNGSTSSRDTTSEPEQEAAKTIMFRVNPEHTGVFLTEGLDKLEPDEKPRWTLDVDVEFCPSPAVIDGVVYFGCYGGFYAVDAVTGKQKWVFKLFGEMGTSPAVAQGLVFFGGWKHSVYALDVNTGKELWRYKTVGNVFSSPTVAGEMLLFGDAGISSMEMFITGGCMHAVNLHTGKEIWKFKTQGRVDSSPAVYDGLVFFGSDDQHIYALDINTGEEKWRYKTGGFVSSSPAVADSVVYVASCDGHLYAMDAQTGNLKWKFEMRLCSTRSSPAVSGNLVFIGSGLSDGHLYAIHAQTGELAWKFPTTDEGIIDASPVVVNDTVYFGDDDGYVRALDTKTGEQKWSFKAGGRISSSIVVDEGSIYFGTSHPGKLYAIGKKNGK